MAEKVAKLSVFQPRIRVLILVWKQNKKYCLKFILSPLLLYPFVHLAQ